MDLIDKIAQLATKIEKQCNDTPTEEATKVAFVMPFLDALGYDVFNPAEIVPEFTADINNKKGEKVDYAIMNNGNPIILIECKKIGSKLDAANEAQLGRYYHVTESRIAILTDGRVYKFYMDLEKPNVMDKKPFFEFNVGDFDEGSISELKQFSKSFFNLDQISTTANELKYIKEIKEFFAEQLDTPTDDFVRFIGPKIHEGRMTQGAVDILTPLLKKAMTQFINDKVNERLKNALSTTETAVNQNDNKQSNPVSTEDDSNKIITTPDEMEGYFIVKSILRHHIDPKRIAYRDTQSYFGILMDDNNRKPICRLRFNSSQKYLCTIDKDRNEEKFAISDLNEIYTYAEKLIDSANSYLNEA